MLSSAFTPALRRAPFALRRPFSSASVAPSLLRPTPIARPPPATLRYQLLVRGAASSLSGRPGSQTVGHAAQNIREELGNSASDLAKTIAGGNVFTDGVKAPNQTFLGITNQVAHSVPAPYIIFGLAGALPYLGASTATVYLAHQAGMAIQGLVPHMDPGVAITLLDQALHLQTTYGAVMLSFLGALHWGFEFAGYGGHKSYARLLLGAAPVVFGWSTLALQPTSALIAQWAGFTTLWWADLKATGAGWTPKWYSQYRFYLSILVGTCIIASLAGTSYWGPVGGHGLVSHDLQMVRAERKKKQLETEGVVKGAVGTAPAQEDSDNYVMIKHNEPKEEPKEQGQQQKQQEKQ